MTFDALSRELRSSRLASDLPLCLDAQRQLARVDTLDNSGVDYVGVGLAVRFPQSARLRCVMVVRFSSEQGRFGKAFSVALDDPSEFLRIATASSVGRAVLAFLNTHDTDDDSWECRGSLIAALDDLKPCRLEDAAWLTSWQERSIPRQIV